MYDASLYLAKTPLPSFQQILVPRRKPGRRLRLLERIKTHLRLRIQGGQSNDRSHFLALPLEIRLMIHREVIKLENNGMVHIYMDKSDFIRYKKCSAYLTHAPSTSSPHKTCSYYPRRSSKIVEDSTISLRLTCRKM